MFDVVFMIHQRHESSKRSYYIISPRVIIIAIIIKYDNGIHMESVYTNQVRHHTRLGLCTCGVYIPKTMMILCQHSPRSWYGVPTY